MITWYKDNDLKIKFDRIPDVDISYPMPFYGEDRNKAICNKPFVNKEPLLVILSYGKYTYAFKVPSGYEWDGASIPRLFWRIIGSNTNPEFIIASMLHDRLCENHHFIDNDRYLSTLVLEKCLKVAGVGNLKRWLMKHCVDNYQKFCW